MANENYNDLSAGQQQELASLSNELIKLHKMMENLALPPKFGSAITTTNITYKLLAHYLKIAVAETASDYLDPSFLVAQGAGIAAGLPFFVAIDYLVVFGNNIMIQAKRKEYGITDELIESAEGKLDGFKLIEYKPFTIALIKFMIAAVSAFVIFTAALNLAMLIDNPAIALMTILASSTTIVAALSVVVLKGLSLPAQAEGLLGIWAALSGLGLAAVLLEVFPISEPIIAKIAEIFLGPLLGAVFSAIPGSIASSVDWIKLNEEVERILDGKQPRSSTQLLGASAKQLGSSISAALCSKVSANDSPAAVTVTEETGLLQHRVNRARQA